jgi:hypothetical protein
MSGNSIARYELLGLRRHLHGLKFADIFQAVEPGRQLLAETSSSRQTPTAATRSGGGWSAGLRGGELCISTRGRHRVRAGHEGRE